MMRQGMVWHAIGGVMLLACLLLCLLCSTSCKGGGSAAQGTVAAEEGGGSGQESAAGASPGAEPPGEPLSAVRSFALAIHNSWLNQPWRSYEELWPELEQLAAVMTPEKAATLLEDKSLTVVERHLVEIALALKEGPGAFADAEGYYEWWVRRGCRTRIPTLPRLKPEHLTPEYRAAWEWRLLTHWTHMGGPTPAHALAAIGDTRSLELMVVVYQWAFQRQGTALAAFVVMGLGHWKQEGLPQALEAARECWAYTQSLVGQELPWGPVTQDCPEGALNVIAWSFPVDFIASQSAEAEPGSVQAAFLQAVQQQRPR